MLMVEPNDVYVSRRKPAINYVLAVQTQASQGQDPINIRARGNNINKAVDVAQIAINRFLDDFKVNGIQIGTDTFKTEQNKDRNVSTILIVLRKTKHGIKDGDWVVIESARGKAKQRARLTSGVDPRVVSAQHGWWFPEVKTPDHGWQESNINMLTDNDPGSYDVAMGATNLRVLMCKVYPDEDN